MVQRRKTQTWNSQFVYSRSQLYCLFVLFFYHLFLSNSKQETKYTKVINNFSSAQFAHSHKLQHTLTFAFCRYSRSQSNSTLCTNRTTFHDSQGPETMRFNHKPLETKPTYLIHNSNQCRSFRWLFELQESRANNQRLFWEQRMKAKMIVGL